MKLVKFFLLAFLIFLPFKWLLSTSIFKDMRYAAIAIQSSDKIILIVGLFIVTFYRIYTKKAPKREEIVLLIPIGLILVWDSISGIVNRNLIWVTGAGAFYHVKNFLIVFLFSAIKWTENDIQHAYKTLRTVAIALGVFSLVQESVTLLSQFMYGDPSRLIFWPSAFSEWRFGMYRSPSLVGHPNIMGIYTLLFVPLELFLNRSKLNMLCLTSSIYFTFSRMTYIAYTGIIALFVKKRKWLIALIIWPIVYLLVTSQTTALEMSLPDHGYHANTTTEGTNQNSSQSLIMQSKFRGYVISKSIEIWKDHKMFGVGPGMYGDVVSFIANSPVYANYNWDEFYFNFAKLGKNLDQFYPVVLAESGFVSPFLFILLFIVLSVVPFIILRQSDSQFIRELMKGLITLPMIISVLLMVNTINMSFLWFPYLALLGMSIGYLHYQGNEKEA